MRALVLVGLLLSSEAIAQGTTYTPGYTRRDGSYVAPHYQTAPNNTLMDNWSTRGNVNPYTGERGTRDPYGSPTPYGSGRGTGSSGFSSPYGRPYR